MNKINNSSDNVTKTIETSFRYHKRAISLIKKAYFESKEMNDSRFKSSYYKDIDGKSFIGLDLYSTSAFFKLFWVDLSNSTIRTYRSSILYFAELELKSGKINDAYYERVSSVLKSIKSTKDKKNKEKNTSSKKQKHLNPKDLKFIDSSLKKSRSKWSKPLRVWLRAGILVGLRPIEWKSSRYDKDSNSIIVANAKNTNGRANGDFRTLNLNHLSSDDISIVKQQVALANKFNSADLWNDYYNGCSNLIRYTSRKIWPNRKKRPTLYSTRHQYCANLKASGMKTTEVASLMGHATDDTAAETYGKKVVGTKGRKPEVNQSELVNVKSKFSNKFNKKNVNVLNEDS